MQAAARTLFTLSSLFLGFALLQMGNGLQGTLLAVRGGLEGFGSTSIGLLMAGFFGGMCLGSFSASTLIAQAGHIRTFAALASLGSAAALGHLLFIDPVFWIVLRVLTGFCFAGLIIVVESWLNATAVPEARGRVLSLYAICSMGASIIGQLLFTIATPEGFILFVLVSILMSVALVPISLSKVSAPLPDGEQESPSVRRLWEFSPFGAVAMLLMGACLGALYGLTPVYGQQLGFNQSQIGIMMAAVFLGGVILQYPLGVLSDRVNRRFVSIVAALVAAGVCASIGLAGNLPFLPALLVFGVAGATILPNTSVIIAHVNDRAPVTALVAVSGGLVLMLGLGAVIGPILSGVLMEIYGPAALVIFVGGLQAAIALFGLVRIFLVEGPSAGEKSSFTAAPIAPVVGEIEISAYESASPVVDATDAEADTGADAVRAA